MARSGLTRGLLILFGVLAFLAVTEVVLHLVKAPSACVQVENVGVDPIEDLVVSAGDSRTVVGRIEPGATAKAYLSGRGEQTLLLTFHQRGNALGSFQHPGFDPDEMMRDGFKLVLRIRPGEVERYQDMAEPTTPLGRLAQNAWQNFLKALGLGPDVQTP